MISESVRVVALVRASFPSRYGPRPLQAQPAVERPRRMPRPPRRSRRRTSTSIEMLQPLVRDAARPSRRRSAGSGTPSTSSPLIRVARAVDRRPAATRRRGARPRPDLALRLRRRCAPHRDPDRRRRRPSCCRTSSSTSSSRSKASICRALAQRGESACVEVRRGVYETARARAAGLQVVREVYAEIDPGGVARRFSGRQTACSGRSARRRRRRRSGRARRRTARRGPSISISVSNRIRWHNCICLFVTGWRYSLVCLSG